MYQICNYIKTTSLRGIFIDSKYGRTPSFAKVDNYERYDILNDMFNKLGFTRAKELIVELQLGAYYSIKSKNDYAIIRLLDLPGDSYHCQLIRTNVAEVPEMSELKYMKPEILHIPMDITNLLGKEMKYLGGDLLETEDLYGYSVYLEEMGADSVAINDHFMQLIRLSGESPQKVRLYPDGDSVSAEHL